MLKTVVLSSPAGFTREFERCCQGYGQLHIAAAWCGFVSYGGVSGGLRAAQLEEQLVTTLKMMPMAEGVAVPMVAQLLDQDKNFMPNDLIKTAATTMLHELHRWAEALKAMRG